MENLILENIENKIQNSVEAQKFFIEVSNKIETAKGEDLKKLYRSVTFKAMSAVLNNSVRLDKSDIDCVLNSLPEQSLRILSFIASNNQGDELVKALNTYFTQHIIDYNGGKDGAAV